MLFNSFLVEYIPAFFYYRNKSTAVRKGIPAGKPKSWGFSWDVGWKRKNEAEVTCHTACILVTTRDQDTSNPVRTVDVLWQWQTQMGEFNQEGQHPFDKE